KSLSRGNYIQNIRCIDHRDPLLRLTNIYFLVTLFLRPPLPSPFLPFSLIFILTLESASEPSSPSVHIYPKKAKKDSGNSLREARFIFGSTKDPAPLRFFGIGSSSSSPFFLRFRVFFFFLSSSSSSSYSAPSSSIAFNHSFSVKLSV
ncbi:hypothetical protein ALC53_02399, partial [Atta colombica]